MRIRGAAWWMSVLLVGSGSAFGTEVFREDFEKDDPALQLSFPQTPERTRGYDTNVVRTGRHSLPKMGYDTNVVHEGRRSLCAMSWNRNLPPAGQGILTFWLFDDLSLTAWRSAQVAFKPAGTGRTDTVYAHLSQINSLPYYCSSKQGSIHPDRINWPIRRVRGWHCYQFVLPAGTGSRQVQVYLDGNWVYTVPDPVSAFRSMGVNADYGGPLWLDEVTLNDDPDTFQPNWVKPPVEGINTLDLTAEPGRPFEVPVTMRDVAGMTGPVELRATLFDWYEQPIARAAATVPAPRNRHVTIPLNLPATDGLYWLKVEALKGGVTVGGFMVKTRMAWTLPVPPASTRARISLEGFWDFKPEAFGNDNGTLILRDWQKMYVPWPLPLGRLVDIQEATYRRQVAIPADWKGRSIVLAIHEPQVKATVTINDRKVGAVEWPGGKLDISSAVAPGQTATIAIFLETLNQAGMRKLLLAKLGKLPADYMENRESRHGLCGAVTLESEPAGAKIGDVFIRPELRPRSLTLETEVAGLRAGETYRLQADIFDGGRRVKTFEAAGFKAIDTRTQKITFASPWPEVRLWNLGDPWLYRLRLTLLDARGTPLDTTLPETFGFRNLLAQDRFLLLNGRKVTLFNPPVCPSIDSPGYFTMMRTNLYNWVTGNHQAGFAVAAGGGYRRWDDDMEILDQLGMAGDIPVGCGLNRIIGPRNLQDDPDVLAMMNHEMEYPIRRYRNHPSLMFYYGCHGGSIPNPGAMICGFLMDGRWLIDATDLPETANIFKLDRRVIETSHRLDPTRLITAQDAGNFGDTIHVTHYAGWMPNQEVADANEIWVKYGAKPYLISEQDAPFGHNWGDQTRKGGYGAKGVIPCFMEWAAISHGDDAFIRTDLDVAQLQAYEAAARRDYGWANQGLVNIYDNLADPNQAYQSIFYRVGIERKRAQVLAWRTFNITAYCDWRSSGELISSAVHRDVYRDVIGYLGGDPAHLTDASANIRPGETITKSFIGLNNGNTDVPAVIRWTMGIDGRRLVDKEEKVLLKAGETTVTPLSFTFTSRDAGRGTLEAVLRVGGREVCRDSLPVTVIQPPAPHLKGRVALIDPEFATRALMERLGIPFTLLNFGEDLSGYSLVIVGRRAMTYERAYRASGFDMARALDDGVNVLMMGQKEEVLRNRFGLRTEYIGARFVYIRDINSPAVKGLQDRDLRNWRGSASLVDPFQASRNESGQPMKHNLTQWSYLWNDGKEHQRPFKWGDRGTVATIVLHKPERGNFVPLLDCEFNLDYTPLMEYRSGNGRLMFCQMDIEGRTEDHFNPVTDPVADTLFVNLVESLSAKSEAVAWNKVAYLGGPRGDQWLESLRVARTKVAAPANLRNEKVLIIGELSEAEAAAAAPGVQAFADHGGTAFVLPQDGAALSRLLPFPCQVRKTDVHQAIVGKTTNSLLRGLGNADFYWKGILPVDTLSGLPAGSLALDPGILAQVPQGNGSYVLMQYGPDTFPYDRGRFTNAVAEARLRLKQKTVELPGDRQAREQREMAFNAFHLENSQRVSFRTINRLLDNLNVALMDYLYLAPSAGTQFSTVAVDLTGPWQICTSVENEDTPPPPDSPRWKPIAVPGYWKDQVSEMKNYKGFVWYRKDFDCPDTLDPAGRVALHIGSIADEDWAYLNSQFIGRLGMDIEPNTYWFTRREYKLTAAQMKASLLRKGSNTLTIRVNNIRLDGGIWRGPVKIVYSIPQNSPDLVSRRSPYIRQDIGVLDDPYMYQGW